MIRSLQIITAFGSLIKTHVSHPPQIYENLLPSSNVINMLYFSSNWNCNFISFTIISVQLFFSHVRFVSILIHSYPSRLSSIFVLPWWHNGSVIDNWHKYSYNQYQSYYPTDMWKYLIIHADLWVITNLDKTGGVSDLNRKIGLLRNIML